MLCFLAEIASNSMNMELLGEGEVCVYVVILFRCISQKIHIKSISVFAGLTSIYSVKHCFTPHLLRLN